MRISTNIVYQAGVQAIAQQQGALLKVQQQVATGRRVLTPSDDPVASARGLELSQSAALNSQFAENRSAARSTLELAEGTLSSVTDRIQDIRLAAVQAGSAALTPADRAMIAIELKGHFQQLIGLANSTSEAGEYLFSGYQGATQPFTQTSAGAQYFGDQGEREIQVSGSRALPVSFAGDDLFARIRNGNGVFATGANAANTGTGIVSPGTVIDASLLTGNDYQIVFTVAAGATTYDVLDVTGGTTLSSGNAFVSGQSISFDGLQLEIEGSPANGDIFSVEPSRNTSLFETVNDLVSALDGSSADPAGSARLANQLSSALTDLDQALTHVLGKRAAVGARLNEIDSLENLGSDLDLQYQTELSRLLDLDYAKAISELQQRQTYLEAAQKSFVNVTGLSLFNYL